MAFGQPFYTYPNGTQPNQFYGGYNAQQGQPNYLFNNQVNAAQNAQNQPLGAFQQQQQMQQTIPPKTNIIPVASLIDAMSRSSEPNTDALYVDQDNPYFYRIMIDMQGRKTYKTLKVEDVTEEVAKEPVNNASANIDLSIYATKEDLKALEDKITNYAVAMGAGAYVTTAQNSSRTKPVSKTADKTNKGTEE